MITSARAYLAVMAQTVGPFAVARLLGLQVLIAIFEGAGLALLAPVLQSLGGANELTVPGLGTALSLEAAFGLVLLVVVLRSLAQWRAAVLSVEIRLTTIDALRLRLVDDLFRADWSYLAEQRRSHVVQTLTSEVERANNALVALLRVVVGTLVLGMTVGVAVLLSPVIGGCAAIGLLLLAAASRRSIRTATHLGQAMTAGVAGFGAAITDSLASARLTRAHDAAQAWTALVDQEARRIRDIRRTFVRKTAGIVGALGVAVVLAVLILVIVGREAGMPFAELAALVVVASRLLNAAQGLLGSVQLYANDAPALDALTRFEQEIGRHREVVGTATTPTTVDPEAPLVELRRITMRYSPDGPAVLQEIDLDVPRRSFVTISGASGSGKSTLLDVVLGLLHPESGEILVDGAPRTDLAAWRARVGYVPQQTVLVPGTVWENLAWSLQPGRQVTRDDAWAALTSACLDTVVRRLPGGLDASLREITELSGGEQQRLSIARALLRDPELLVLDEATSALDTATESQVLDRLLDGSRAVLLVTHRPSDRARADRVAHLQDGRLELSP